VQGCGAHAREDGVLVLDAVRLIDDDVAPVELFEVVLLLYDTMRWVSFYCHDVPLHMLFSS